MLVEVDGWYDSKVESRSTDFAPTREDCLESSLCIFVFSLAVLRCNWIYSGVSEFLSGLKVATEETLP